MEFNFIDNKGQKYLCSVQYEIEYDIDSRVLEFVIYEINDDNKVEIYRRNSGTDENYYIDDIYYAVIETLLKIGKGYYGYYSYLKFNYNKNFIDESDKIKNQTPTILPIKYLKFGELYAMLYDNQIYITYHYILKSIEFRDFDGVYGDVGNIFDDLDEAKGYLIDGYNQLILVNQEKRDKHLKKVEEYDKCLVTLKELKDNFKL